MEHPTTSYRKRSLAPLALALALGATAACSNPDPEVRFESGDETVADGTSLAWTFDELPAERAPDQAVVFDGSWTVVASDAPASAPNELCQTATAEFPALELGQEVLGDMTMSARVRMLTGEEDRAAGLAFRIQDSENYYILRANALEQNVSFYKYAGGERQFLDEDTAAVEADVWHTLTVVVSGDALQAYFDDELIVEIEDQTFTAGRVGLWTKADSVTCFDDVVATAG